jgi:hypothetical protein
MGGNQDTFFPIHVSYTRRPCLEALKLRCCRKAAGNDQVPILTQTIGVTVTAYVCGSELSFMAYQTLPGKDVAMDLDPSETAAESSAECPFSACFQTQLNRNPQSRTGQV